MATLVATLRRPTNPAGLWAWITTVDHKRIGVLYGLTALAFFLVAGAEALVMRLQLMRPEQSLVSPEVYNQLLTMHGTAMIFLVVMPLNAALFNFLVPLMIGARDVAFPRLNAFSYWAFLFGGIMLHTSWFLGGAPNAGWFGYSPLTAKAFNPGHGIDFWVLSLQLLGVASMASAFNFIVTIINMRAPGMSLFRMPVFVWMTLVTSFLIAFSFPVITVALIFLMFDRLFGMNFYNPAAGADPLLWQHLFWIFGHPEVYILILPTMGVVSEVLPTFSRKPLFGYPVVVFSGILIGFMGWAVWVHHMFTTGLGPVVNTVFALSTMAIAIPTGIKIFNWVATMWGGSLNYKTPLLFAAGFIALFMIGGISGVMHSVAPSDTQQHDTYFVVAHFHYVLFGGALFGIFAGIYYWFPKVTGRLMNEALGRLHFALLFLGFNLTFFPMHFLGLDGMPRRIYTYDASMGWGLWNTVATVGALVTAVAVLAFLHNLFYSLRRGQRAGNDPWDGRTLEWAIPSPPPPYNFEVIPRVEARDAFWWQKHGRGAPAVVPRTGGEYMALGQRREGIHLPHPSYWPVAVALGLMVAAYGAVYLSLPTIFAGMIVTVLSIYAWVFEPVAEPEES